MRNHASFDHNGLTCRLRRVGSFAVVCVITVGCLFFGDLASWACDGAEPDPGVACASPSPSPSPSPTPSETPSASPSTPAPGSSSDVPLYVSLSDDQAAALFLVGGVLAMCAVAGLISGWGRRE